jgi:hypothetical protein
MKTRQSLTTSRTASVEPQVFPNADELAALRGWYAGLSSRAAVDRYLSHARAPGASARGILGAIRRQLSTLPWSASASIWPICFSTLSVNGSSGQTRSRTRSRSCVRCLCRNPGSPMTLAYG